uniref:MATH domain-containing protein n=1 Tax=Anopheles coluzzii TaxID=1518534 RepID=A0A8W7NZQ4_ANOCL
MATGTTTNGRLMFTQTSCYLCSDWLDDSDVEIHLRKCRRQQTVCPNRCGAIVAKKDLQLHSNTCPKSYGMESSNEPSNEYVTPPNEEQVGEELSVEQVLQTLENDISSLQLLQTAQKEKHTDVQSELAHLKNYYDVSHRWTGKVYESIVALYKMCYQDKMQHSLDISGLREQLKGTNEWRTDIVNRIDALEKTLFFVNQDRAAIEQDSAQSKELETMMKGPIFTNYPYGYMLQLEVSLYGIGTWRGRNMIAGLTILPGPYDELLEWPCRLSATICVRDQAANPAEAVPIYKPIVAKVKGQRDKNQHYVYVPHDQLYSRGYVKKDTLFLEVFVGEEGSDSSEL